jgi:hypothetical protein
MPLSPKVRSFLRNLFLSRRVEVDPDQEVHSQFELLMEENIRAGLPQKEAQRAARIALGGIEQVKEQVREKRIGNGVRSLISDCRLGLRQLRNNPGFTAVAVLTLALGIGADAAIFSVIDSVLLRPLPNRNPAGLVMVWESNSQQHNSHNVVSPPDFLAWQSRNSVFAGMAAIIDEHDNLTGNGVPQEVLVQLVSANFFSVLGVNPILGSGFSVENGQPGQDRIVVLSYGFWKER